MNDPGITAEWIRAQRKAHDLTQEALAELVGYSVEAIRKVEQGRHPLSPKLRQRLLKQWTAAAVMLAPRTFAPWLAARRKALDLTQDQLAAIIGCAVVTIRKLEAGTLRPSRPLAALLAPALAVPPAAQATFVLWTRGIPGAPPPCAGAPSRGIIPDTHYPDPQRIIRTGLDTQPRQSFAVGSGAKTS